MRNSRALFSVVSALRRRISCPAPKGGRKARRIVVWDKTETGWKVLEGEVGGAEPCVRNARIIDGELASEAVAQRDRHAKSEIVLIVRSGRCICRELQLPPALDEETRRMLALRLEAELPYALSDATWSYQRRQGTGEQAANGVLLVAVPTDDIALLEEELKTVGQKCGMVECHEAALAQVVAALVPGVETAAIAEIETGSAVLAVTRNGKLSYARRISRGTAEQEEPLSPEAEASHLANEIDQSLRHYAMSKGGCLPEKLLLVGEPDAVARIEGALGERDVAVVETLPAPEWLRFTGRADVREVFRQFTSCVGALVAMDRRLRHREAAAPPLRLAARGPRRPQAYRRAGLVAVNVILAAALIASSFGVRQAKLRGATKAIAEARAFLQDVEVLQEEVAILKREKERSRSTLDIFLAVVEAVPKGVVVTDLNIDSKGNVTIVGRAPSIEVADRAVSALGASGTFAQPRLWRASREKEGLVFRITCVVR